MSAVGIPGYLFLLIFGLVLPYLVLKASLKPSAAQAAKAAPPRPRYFLAVLVNQAFFVLIAILVARVEWVDIFARGVIGGKALLLAAGTLVVAVLSVPLRWKLTPDEERRRLLSARPAKAGDLGPWFLVSLSAGFVEEIVYRGVMATLLLRLTGSWPVAVVVSIAAFVLAHGGRGRHRLIVIALLAVVFHVLVRLTGTLYLAMALHFLYDFIAGVIYIELGKRMPPAPVPAEPVSPAGPGK
jgi:membrane protease YdiL (CAAX protease family)